jgi:hypothetical protein
MLRFDILIFALLPTSLMADGCVHGPEDKSTINIGASSQQ